MDPAPVAAQPRRAYPVWGRVVLFLAILPGIALLNPIHGINSATREKAQRAAESQNLGFIVKSRLLLEEETQRELPPEALTDVYALAAHLARAGLNSPGFWISKLDHLIPGGYVSELELILKPGTDGATATIDPVFERQPLAWAVALVPSISKLPPDTPVAWTRGLRPDGKWRADSLYPAIGGYVVSADARVVFYKYSIDGQFFKWGTRTPTSNIAEALPPGTRVSESRPGGGDAVQSSWTPVWMQMILGLVMLAVPFLLLLHFCRIAARPQSNPIVRGCCTLVNLVCSAWFWLGLASLVAELHGN